MLPRGGDSAGAPATDGLGKAKATIFVPGEELR